ncbi:DUF5034 domain-containing protein [Cryomorpha ignava]|uniref:DUF5034 domain-containing protein n=1 Tax=Cryomorpha ignava TaxID=101383 RepID=A0A7K3WNM7_9FLAO|nr:DUF5034 domain-containing protein [Cryomorpha ignava]NEN23257.1 DUF5034 domain-containing protein [Cryomorpha ignava]
MKRLILIGLLLFIADFFIACCRCDSPPIIEYKRCELEVFNLKYTDTEYDKLITDSIETEKYGIQLQFTQKENTCQVKSSGLFVNTALACSCDETNGKALDRFQSIKIFTVHPFDSIHPAESDITKYFIAGMSYWDQTSIPEYVAYQNNYDDGMTYFGHRDILSIRLNAIPDSTMTRQFKIEATMTDGRVLTQNSPLVVLY